MTIDKLANVVCEKLPEGYIITLGMEKGSAWLELFWSEAPLDADEFIGSGPVDGEETLEVAIQRLVGEALEHANEVQTNGRV